MSCKPVAFINDGGDLDIGIIQEEDVAGNSKIVTIKKESLSINVQRNHVTVFPFFCSTEKRAQDFIYDFHRTLGASAVIRGLLTMIINLQIKVSYMENSSCGHDITY